MATKTTTLRRCVGSARFGIEPHEAPVADFPKQPSQKDGIGRMCRTHWSAYVKGLREGRKPATGSASTGTQPAMVESKPSTKQQRQRTPMANKPEPKPESPRVRKARELLATTEKLGGPAYLEAFGSDEVHAALETVNGNGHDPEESEAIEAIGTELDPRSEDEIRALEGDAA